MYVRNKILETPFFYGASPETFRKAERLRKNMTIEERILWQRLSRNQLIGFRFRRQHPIDIFIVDFYCHAARLVVEMDGNIHDSQEAKEWDAGRTVELEAFGLKVIRFTNDEIHEKLDEVINKIISYL